MSNERKKRSVFAVGASEHRSPEQLRKIGRALIALARAQLEAEAEASHKESTPPNSPTTSKKREAR